RSNRLKRNCGKSIRPRQLLAPNVAGLIRNCCLELDAREKPHVWNTCMSINSNLSHSHPAKFLRAIVSKTLQMVCRRALFAPRVSFVSRMAGGYSILWRAVGDWGHFNWVATNFFLLGRTSLLKKRQSSARLINAPRNDEALMTEAIAAFSA